jgi:hypothetical protein
VGDETEGTGETHRHPSTNYEETHDECRWPEGDSGRRKKKMGVDTGGQSGFAICEEEVGEEGGKQVQEGSQGSVANSPVGLHLLVHGIVVVKQRA